MCVMSMVHDHFYPIIPTDWRPSVDPVQTIDSTGAWPFTSFTGVAALRAEVAALAKVVADFRAAVEAARTVDALTAQPDCVDPEKARLTDRVDELERRLNAIGAAFVNQTTTP